MKGITKRGIPKRDATLYYIRRVSHLKRGIPKRGCDAVLHKKGVASKLGKYNITIPEFTKEESLQLRKGGGRKCPNRGKICSLVQKVSKDCNDNKFFLSYQKFSNDCLLSS